MKGTVAISFSSAGDREIIERCNFIYEIFALKKQVKVEATVNSIKTNSPDILFKETTLNI